ncbi:hypothetical protein Q7V69_09185, partial [Streptococcus suis]|nr:hypothetical protein [Streptococcus suis]MDW8672460.1 hypothetical protein [Streptococcus suis]
NRKKKWKLKALAATSIAGGFLVFLYEKNWLEAIIKKRATPNWNCSFFMYERLVFAQPLSGDNNKSLDYGVNAHQITNRKCKKQKCTINILLQWREGLLSNLSSHDF